jgi:hypothetical protein
MRRREGLGVGEILHANQSAGQHVGPHMASLSCEERNQLWCHVTRPSRRAQRLLVDDELAAATTGTVSKQEVPEAILRLPRGGASTDGDRLREQRA